MRPLIVAVLIVASVMALGHLHPFGDPRVEPAKGLGTLLQGAKMPADTKAVLVTSRAARQIVAHALVRAASPLLATPDTQSTRDHGVEMSLDTARTSACATPDCRNGFILYSPGA